MPLVYHLGTEMTGSGLLGNAPFAHCNAVIHTIDNRNFDLVELLARYVGRNRNVNLISMILL